MTNLEAIADIVGKLQWLWGLLVGASVSPSASVPAGMTAAGRCGAGSSERPPIRRGLWCHGNAEGGRRPNARGQDNKSTDSGSGKRVYAGIGSVQPYQVGVHPWGAGRHHEQFSLRAGSECVRFAYASSAE
jgi:hypothetical protein